MERIAVPTAGKIYPEKIENYAAQRHGAGFMDAFGAAMTGVKPKVYRPGKPAAKVYAELYGRQLDPD